MAHHPPTPRPSVTSLQIATRCILLLTLDEELIALLRSALPSATSLSPLSIRPDTVLSKESSPASPNGAQPSRTHQLNASSSALSSPDYVARLIRSANITTILIDLRGHANELGLSCGFLAALKSVGFAGHVLYVSVSGDLLKPAAESRELREAYPVHAAVEMQLQNTGIKGSPSRFNWTVLGRSTEPMDSPTPSPISPPTDRPMSFTQPAQSWRESGDFRDRPTASRSSSLSANETARTPTSELVEGVVRAIRNHSTASNGRKIMLDLATGRRRSFMHQTDWRPD
ncbi:hypothetical protein M409DRAFT_51768 [Zasmidium cellare ATCC 36951]|uniref:Uncharacterized protein n=1 Tax=Zasmidium cellare ATCC 36951 TaxID=1080233 RepID=A0A6A6CUX0_ZASCE|nr:uncharacterized protein M409DRAFT_51768 [Zasmidium cellare ATCC 36951]KAF2169988.1 hypothetical protein M409DRAFT_51768 [Zasmidium cellare ATCC 36951]